MEPEEPLGPRRSRMRSRNLGRDLEDLAKESAEVILQRLGSDGGGLAELLKTYSLSDDKIYHLLVLFRKCLIPQARQFNPGSIKSIVDLLLDSESQFLSFTLYTYVRKYLCRGRSDEDNMTVLGGTLAVIDVALTTMPRFAMTRVHQYREILPDKLRDFPDPGLEKQFSRIIDTFTKLDKDLEKQRSGEDDAGRRGNAGTRGLGIQRDEDRPEDTFRALPLIPTQRDLTENDQLLVRKNRVTGRYEDLEDYLDVQFRLFRADFILPLRESIEKYLGAHDADQARGDSGGGRGMRVYRDVHVLRPVCADKDLAYRLSFDVGKLGNVDWRKTQRLKFGSLLCLSDDNFQTFLWATVHEHKADLLNNGLVDVVFVAEDRYDLKDITDINRNRRFVMVESPAYFEAYRHVLQGLKNLNDHNFPFVRYIVQCERDVNPPRYLQQGRRRVKYDFTPLIDDEFKITPTNRAETLAEALQVPGVDEDDDDLGGVGVDVMSGQNWPTHDDLRLDDSQYKALHAALTREVAVIQGPPGTGKTYLGLKIMKMLLHNQQAWNSDADGKHPLLVVCYTNHALDQFLEGILNFFQAPQSALVRVGARSNSERLKEMSLTNHRQRARANSKVPMETHEAKVRTRDELRALRLDIHEQAGKLEILDQEIVREDFLKDFIDPPHMQQLKRSLGRQGSGCGILKWLQLEKLRERLVHQAEHGLKTIPPFKVIKDTHPRVGRHDNDEDDLDDEEEEDAFADEQLLAMAFQDGSSARRLDADDDEDDDDLDFYDLDDLESEAEETERDRLRRRQREVEASTARLREESVALNVSDFDADLPEVVDRTAQTRTKGDNQKTKDELKKLVLRQKRLLQGLLRSVDLMTDDEIDKVRDIWKLSMKDKWRLYRTWADLCLRQMRGEIKDKEQVYFDKAKLYCEILDQEDRTILQQATVIGMTTTGASRYQSILFAIAPKIIVVEEAAEVFEAHVVATLSRECQHLILIGDHKQLRPNPTVHELARKCQLDISLFERLVSNEFPMECLQYQHRMRPEISAMMRLQDLYPTLQDHEVVKNLDPIRGVASSVFYIVHGNPEQRNEETKSFSNQHEAKFLVALCDYLLKQDYKKSQITFLTPYSGQVHSIVEQLQRKKMADGGIRVSSVDNFQGEENDIILLSLVRSNNDQDIGFLKFNNRICVALSRAKMGLYVIGNFEVLKGGSDLLDKVVSKAAERGIYSNGLPLQCHNPKHSKGIGILAIDARDFDKAPEGGCNEMCDVRLPCGHTCPRTCHPYDEHDTILCPLPCVRQCEVCGQRCGKVEGQEGEEFHACCEHVHCERLTNKVIPRCGHEQMVPCGADPIGVTCNFPCQQELPCGHRCQSTCGRPCTRDCKVKVKVENPSCKHQYEAPCSERETTACTKPCGEKLVCDHKCRGTCGECRHGSLHVQCVNKCQKILVCGHDCDAQCCQCPPCQKPCENRCSHNKCERECGAPCVRCVMPCDWRCPHKKCTKLCGEQCNREVCDEPCPKQLPKCGHPCRGLCGEACPPCPECKAGKFADSPFGPPDADDRFVLLEDCGHVLEVTSLDQWVGTSMADNHAPSDDSAAARGGDSVRGGGEGEEEDVEERRDRLVKLPECPQCKTPIRRNLRYGNVVKKALAELEEIKKRCRGNPTEVDRLLRRVEHAKTRLPQELRQRVEENLFSQRYVPCESRLATQFYQISTATDVNTLLRQVSSAKTRWPDLAETYRTIQQALDHLMDWTLRPRSKLSDQELFDVRQETQRLQTLIHLMHCRHSISDDKIEVEPRLLRRLAACVRQLGVMGPVKDPDLEEGKLLREELKGVVQDPYSALTDEEREAIVKAVALPTGSWYACPRGHYYVIGECGRPTEVASCPECRSPIGGESHALVPTNRQAPEFDNATGPRWSAEDDFQYALMLQQEEFENWR